MRHGRELTAQNYATTVSAVAFIGMSVLAACNGPRETKPLRTTPDPTLLSSGYTEVVQVPSGVNVFEEYHNASNLQLHLDAGDKIIARCVIYDPQTEISSTAGLWYELPKGSKAGNHVLARTSFVAANTEWNGPTGVNNNDAYDPQVPVCPTSPDKNLPPPTNPHELTPAP